MSDPNEKTPSESPYAMIVEAIVRKQTEELKGELTKIIRQSAAQTAQMIGNALGVWRAEVDRSLNDHEGRLISLERSTIPDILSRLRALEADRPTEPPPPPSGMQS